MGRTTTPSPKRTTTDNYVGFEGNLPGGIVGSLSIPIETAARLTAWATGKQAIQNEDMAPLVARSLESLFGFLGAKK